MRPPSELPLQLRNRPFTVAQARAAGLSRRRTRAEDLINPGHGVRTGATTQDTLLERLRALAAVTGGVVSHLSAAVLWGFPLPLSLDNLAVIHLTAGPGKRAVRHKHVVGHQQLLEPDEIVAGIWVSCTSPLRTWFDLAGILSLDDLVMAGDFLLRRKNPLATVDALDAFLAGKRGRAGYQPAMRARSLMRANTDSPKRPSSGCCWFAMVCRSPESTSRSWTRTDAGSRTRTCPMSRKGSRSSTTARITRIRRSVAATSSEMKAPEMPGGALSY
ncbi:hypothetical protein BJQ90_02441 [Arthrobacter sp. SO3]|nr:hypothetical protein [Arthrobacter sp. SO3]